MKGPFGTSISWGLIAGLILVIASAGILLAYAEIRKLDPTDTVVVNFATVFLSIGAVTLIYDLVLKGRFATDMLALVELKTSLADAGLEEVAKETSVAWHELLDETTNFGFLLPDPSAWVERDWNLVLGAGRKRKIAVDIFLPEPTGATFDALARHMSLESATLKTSIDRAVQQIELSWKNARDSKPGLHGGSSVNVVLIPDFIAFAVVLLDEKAVLLLGGSIGRQAGEAAVAIRFRMGRAPFPWTWLSDQIRVVSDKRYPATYSNVV